MSTLVFLPVGMLDLVPRLHSPPRVAIRGGFLLEGNRRERGQTPITRAAQRAALVIVEYGVRITDFEGMR